MSKNLAVDLTMTLPGVPGRRGRLVTGTAMTVAQRQAKYRRNHKMVETGERIGQTIRDLSDQFDISELVITRELLRFALCNRNWKRTGFPSQTVANDE